MVGLLVVVLVVHVVRVLIVVLVVHVVRVAVLVLQVVGLMVVVIAQRQLAMNPACHHRKRARPFSCPWPSSWPEGPILT